MPPTVSVAAFVFGVVLILAALIGKELKIVTMELPALGPGRRLVLGLLGIGLTAFGLMEGQLPDFKLAAQSPTTQSAKQLVSAAPPPVAAAAQITPLAAGRDKVLPCLGDIAETDLAIVPVDPARRTDVKWGVGQPRAGVLAIQFEDPTGIRGGVKFKTLASATGIDIITVVDGSCQTITSYGNITRPNQPKNAPYNYDAMRYQFGDDVVSAGISYGEGDGKLLVIAQQLVP